MLIAVTGATGFLGRYLVRQLVAQGHRVRCWYRPTSDRGGFEELAAAIDWLPGRLGDPVATDDLTRGADAVVHAALERPDSNSFRNAGRYDLLAFAEHRARAKLGAHQLVLAFQSYHDLLSL